MRHRELGTDTRLADPTNSARYIPLWRDIEVHRDQPSQGEGRWGHRGSYEPLLTSGGAISSTTGPGPWATMVCGSIAVGHQAT